MGVGVPAGTCGTPCSYLALHAFLFKRLITSLSCSVFSMPGALQVWSWATNQLRSLATAAGVRHASSQTLQPSSIWCVGRNYADHIKELDNMGSAPTDAPMIFLKAGATMLPSGSTLQLPPWSKDVHHEVELAVELDEQLQPVRGAVALDLTARDVQATLKKKQWPWTLAKSFKHSTPLGAPFSLQGVDMQQLELRLEVNGAVRQQGSTSMMLFKVEHLLAYVREHFPVQAGDVVLTGTPAGVSALKPGDKLLAQVLADGKVLSEGHWRVQ